MFNIFNKLFKRTVVVNLDANVQLTVTPATAGGVHAVLKETSGIFVRTERCYFATCDDLTKSLMLTDETIVRKLSKAF